MAVYLLHGLARITCIYHVDFKCVGVTAARCRIECNRDGVGHNYEGSFIQLANTIL